LWKGAGGLEEKLSPPIVVGGGKIVPPNAHKVRVKGRKGAGEKGLGGGGGSGTFLSCSPDVLPFLPGLLGAGRVAMVTVCVAMVAAVVVTVA